MTSIANKNAYSAVSASLKLADKSVINKHSISAMCESGGAAAVPAAELQAETIEVVPELPTFNHGDDDDDDSGDEFSEYSDENDIAMAASRHSFQLNNMDDDDDEEEPFDEYAYQVLSNHNEPQAIWFDNSELKSLPEAEDSGDVILIDDDDDDGNGNGNGGGGNGNNSSVCGDFETSNNSLTREPSDNNSSSGEQKLYTCDICHSKLSSSYNLKRHHMIHTGEKPFSCEICQRRFREQSDLRKHKKVHANQDATVKCLVCKRNPTMSRNSSKCSSCNAKSVKTATAAAMAVAAAAATVAKQHLNPMDEILPHFDVNNKKSFVCKWCDRTFGSSSNLKRHIMIHTGEKPFSCPECKRPFREMSTLKKHLITHRKQNGFSSSVTVKPLSALLETRQPNPTAQIAMASSKPKIPSLSSALLHKCPLCKTICKGTEALMNHITSVHRPNATPKNHHNNNNNNNNNGSSNRMMIHRKHTKSPPPLIPINKAAFNYLNAKRI